MTWVGRHLTLAALLSALAVFWTVVASADPAAQLTASTDTVEEGGAIQVQLSADSTEASPSNPRLSTPPGFVIVGPNIGTSQQVSLTSSGFHRQVTFTATWRVNATKLGEFTLGPATVTIDGKQVRTNAVSVRVVGKGTLPRRQRKRPSPFDDDFFQGLGLRGGSLFDDIVQPDVPPEPEQVPPEFQLPSAPDPNAFLRATVTPERAVVGQQVTLRIYAYALRPFDVKFLHESRKPDFFSVALPAPPRSQTLQRVAIENRVYHAVKIQETALFPLKAGDLEISPLSVALDSSRYVPNAKAGGLERSSNPLIVHVEEPPAANRPASYQLGNVGNFELTAVVSNRQAKVGDSISVVATLRGQGNPPTRLNTPDQHAVEWLEPTLQKDIKPDANGKLNGLRTFTYILKLKQPGKFELGALTLDSFNPDQNVYTTSRAELGSIEVTASDEPADARAALAKESSLLDHTVAKLELAPKPATSAPLTDARWYWWLLATLPALSLIIQSSRSSWQRLAAKRAATAGSAAQLAQVALKDAQAELRASNPAAAIGHAERAVFSALEAATGLKPRGFLRSELQQALVAKQLSDELAAASVEFLSQLENARFANPGAAGETLVADAKQLVRSLLAHAA